MEIVVVARGMVPGVGGVGVGVLTPAVARGSGEALGEAEGGHFGEEGSSSRET
jgi:hypothetical protein